MSDIIRIPTVGILRSRDQRLRDKRPASELEALLELQALDAARMLPSSMSETARSLGWSRGKLRRAFIRWEEDAADVGDPSLCPRCPPTWDRA